MPGHGSRHGDNEEGEAGQGDSLDAKTQLSDQSLRSGKNPTSDSVLDRQSTGLLVTKNEDKDRMRGDGSNSMNCKQGAQSLGKIDANSENDKEQQEASGAPKPAKKVRKPDREFYQPGSRRNVQGKDCGVGRELDMPSPKKQEPKPEPESQSSAGKGNNKKSVPNHGGKDKVKRFDSNEETVEKERKIVDPSVEKIISKVEQLNIKEKGGGPSNNVGDGACTRREKERCAHGAEMKGEEEKVDRKEKGSRRRSGGEKEKKEVHETYQESKRENEVNQSKKNNQRRKAEKEKDKRAPNVDRRKSEKPNDNPRENHKLKDNNSNFKDTEKAAKTGGHLDRPVEEGDRHRSNLNATTPNSKRYSKSNIRHSRNRTYSSSSASSVTSQDGPRRQMGMESAKWSRLPGQSNKELMDKCEEQRRHSSTESLDGSEVCDRDEDRRRRTRRSFGKEEIRAVKRGEEWKTSKSNKSRGRGILRVSLDNQSPIRKDSAAPRGRGRGILVLPARTDISNSPEVGQRLFSAGTRGGAAGRNRGGRGGGVRRLWDPNNPDQKPALSNTQSSKQAAPKPPLYLQTGAGYGQLHFLDTDDELAGSPPVPQGDHFQSQQAAAAMAYYKFQNSDNPYCYPIPASNTHDSSSTTSQRYPYAYNVGPYQMPHPNGMYPSPGTSPFSGSFRGVGYTQPGVGGGLTFEEELGRLLKAADAHELQLSNLISRDRVSADGLDRMSQLR